MAPNNGIVSYNYGNGDWLDFEGAQGATPSTRPILHVVLDGGTAVDFQRGVSPAPSYDQVQEAVIALALDPRFFSQDTHHVVSGTNEYASTAGLIRFELPVVPPWVSVTSAALTFWVYFPSPAPHPVYESLRPWTEAATFLTYDGTAGRTGHRGRWRARLEPLGARRAPGGRLDRAAGLHRDPTVGTAVLTALPLSDGDWDAGSAAVTLAEPVMKGRLLSVGCGCGQTSSGLLAPFAVIPLLFIVAKLTAHISRP